MKHTYGITNKLRIVAIALLLVVAGCANGDTEEPSETYKDTLNIAITAQPPLLDAHSTVSNAAAGIAFNIFESLLTLDENYNPTPQLAASYDVSDDSLTYTFILREGIKFHNGDDLTPEDVVASLNRWLSTSSRAKLLLAGAGFSVVDERTVELNVLEATGDVLDLLASPSQFAAITTAKIISEIPEEGLSEYVGTGPYQFVEWRQDQYIKLEKYEDYQSLETASSGFTGVKGQGAKTLIYHFITDHATRIAGVQTGEYDVAESIPLESYDQVAADDNLVVYQKQSGSLNLFLNTSDGLLSDITIRQAILAALDNEEILLASFSDPQLFILHPSFVNLALPQWAVDAGSDYYNQKDPDKAQKLLADAGYNGETITLLTTQDYAEMYNATLVVQEQLRRIGINAEVANYDFATFLDTKNDTSKWDLFITSNAYGLNPTQASVVNPAWAGFDQPKVTDSIAEIRTASTQEEATQAWTQLQEFIYEFGAASVLGHYNSVTVTTTQVEGFDLFHYPVYWNANVLE